MRVFSGGIATETNTFGPMPTGLASFKDRGYFPAGTHPDHMFYFAGPLWAARMRGKEKGWDLVEGLVAGAQPSRFSFCMIPGSAVSLELVPSTSRSSSLMKPRKRKIENPAARATRPSTTTTKTNAVR